MLPTARTEGRMNAVMSSIVMPEMAANYPATLRSTGGAGQLARDPLWYRRAIMYELHVRSFYDSNGDGIGDFPGLIEKLDYLQELGVTALCLLPLYPSPLKDDGYDISNFRQVHPAYGTRRQFASFLREAHRRGLRVIIDLVLNHTSDQHPWFQRARRSPPGSRWREFYVWSADRNRYSDARINFPEFETSNWTWDPVAEAYYWHRFYHHQPDLNYDYPPVRQAMLRVVDFWLSLGVDGLRLNAVPYLFERQGTDCENLPETHDYLQTLRRHVDQRYSQRVLVVDANQWPEKAVAYFGDGNECHCATHFPLMPRFYMAASMEDRGPILEMLEQTPPAPAGCQWIVFLRNHDELALEMVTDEERLSMYRHYARDRHARIHQGIRRRLAPLCQNDRRRIELLSALLLSVPGTPMIYYGDEIGMGDNIFLGDRHGIRTPMQWNGDRNAGFSLAEGQQVFLPAIRDPRFHYGVVNVANQRRDPASLWSWMRQALTLRQQSPALMDGSLQLLTPKNAKILAFLRQSEDSTVLVVANLARRAQVAELELPQSCWERVPVEMFGQEAFPLIGSQPYYVMLPPFAFFWFRLRASREVNQAHETPWGHSLRSGPPPAVIQLDGDWETVFQPGNWSAIEQYLPSFLATRRWYGGKARRLRSTSITEMIGTRVLVEGREVRLTLIEVEFHDAETQRYMIPLGIANVSRLQNTQGPMADAIVTQLRSARDSAGDDNDAHDNRFQVAALYDVFGEPEVSHGLLTLIAARRQHRGYEGTLQPRIWQSYRRLRGDPSQTLPARPLKGETSNSGILLGDRLILKLYRRLDEGTNPELEIGAFLSDEVGFHHTPPVAGAVEYTVAGQEPVTLMLLTGLVRNEGSGWEHCLGQLAEFLDRIVQGTTGQGTTLQDPPADTTIRSPWDQPGEESEPLPGPSVWGDYGHWAGLLGRRTAEMHLALASDAGNPAFAAEAFTKLYQRSLYQSLRSQAKRAIEFLGERLDSLPAEIQASGQRVLAARDSIQQRLALLLDANIVATRIRCHGDYHLGQVLFTGTDFVMIDFEGEPARPLSERRIKTSPLRDVAGMLRSFDYASHAARSDRFGSIVLPDEERAKLDAWLRLWSDCMSTIYLNTYLAVARGASFLPDRQDDLRALLDAYLLDKVLYELQYELNNRPHWSPIPLGGLLRLVPGE